MNENAPFFIVGVPRSGTTLLRTLVCEHPQIAIPPETHFICTWMQKYSSPQDCWENYAATPEFSTLMIDPVKVSERIKQQSTNANGFYKIFNSILIEYASSKQKKRVGEKTPGNYEHLDTIFSWYPNCKIIWIIRDPRALCASYLKTPWSKDDVLIPAFRWRKSMTLLNKWKEDHRILAIDYENLILKPKNTLKLVWEFLGEESVTIDYTNRSSFTDKDKCTNKWEYSHLVAASRPISTQPLNKWKAELSSRQIELIEFISQAGMKQKQYTIAPKKTLIKRTWTLIALLWQLIKKPHIVLTSLYNKISKLIFKSEHTFTQ